MKLYFKSDRKIKKLHKDLIRKFQDKTGTTDYGLLWLTLAKGFIIGAILL